MQLHGIILELIFVFLKRFKNFHVERNCLILNKIDNEYLIAILFLHCSFPS